MPSDKFWIDEPCVLFTELSIIPTKDMSRNEKLNALTRLVLLIAAGLWVAKYKQWKAFLLLGILFVVLVYCAGDHKKKPIPSTTSVDESDSEPLTEGFSVTPTYLGTDFNQTIVSPTFSEEWQIPPPAYDIYTQVPYTGDEKGTFEMPMIPQSYPYGQYLTRTNLLPMDEYYIHMGCGGTQTAREYANSAFLRHRLAESENMTRLFKKKLNRRFRHNTQDTFSPYHSY